MAVGLDVDALILAEEEREAREANRAQHDRVLADEGSLQPRVVPKVPRLRRQCSVWTLLQAGEAWGGAQAVEARLLVTST